MGSFPSEADPDAPVATPRRPQRTRRKPAARDRADRRRRTGGRIPVCPGPAGSLLRHGVHDCGFFRPCRSPANDRGQPLPNDRSSSRGDEAAEGAARVMTWTVIWLDDAEDQLAATYLLAVKHNRAAECTTASDRVEAILSTAPTTAGESRSRRGRMLFERPLAVTFEVHEPERVV